jgi:histidine ammonia-lyase
LLAEMRVLAHPASVDSVPTSGNKEDHVSMGLTAARKAKRSVADLEYVLGIELMCAAQALEFLKPLQPGRAMREAYRLVRARVRSLDADRTLTPDIEALRAAIRAGEFAEIARPASPAPSGSRRGRRRREELDTADSRTNARADASSDR